MAQAALEEAMIAEFREVNAAISPAVVSSMMPTLPMVVSATRFRGVKDLLRVSGEITPMATYATRQYVMIKVIELRIMALGMVFPGFLISAWVAAMASTPT